MIVLIVFNRGLFNLVTHYDRMKTKDKLTIMIRTIVLLKSLQVSGFFGGKKSPGDKLSDDELYIGELLFHFQCGIQYNLHTVYQVMNHNSIQSFCKPINFIAVLERSTELFSRLKGSPLETLVPGSTPQRSSSTIPAFQILSGSIRDQG